MKWEPGPEQSRTPALQRFLAANQLLKRILHHPANRGSPVRSVLRALSWQAYKRLYGASRMIDVWGGIEFEVFPASTAASAVLYFNGMPDYHEMGFMARYLRKGDRFLDVGANVGTYTLFAAQLAGREGWVDSLEPGQHARERLEQQVKRNAIHHVSVWPCAASDRTGAIRFSHGRDTMDHIIEPNGAPMASVPVIGIRLDEHFAGNSYAMGKMDIEGAEPLALAEAEQMLRAPKIEAFYWHCSMSTREHCAFMPVLGTRARMYWPLRIRLFSSCAAV